MTQEANDRQEEILNQGPEVDLINYKFLCAHCEERFIEQEDLEIHVNEMHRPKTHISQNEITVESPITRNSSTNEDMPEATKQIAVFQNYDSDDDKHYASESDLLKSFQGSVNENQFTEATHIIQKTFNKEIQMGEDANVHCNETTQFQNDTTASSIETEESSNDTISLEDNESTDLKPFTCAKCPETFASIEQLRQHYEQHIAASHHQQHKSPNKLKFKCNLCSKSFDLKFSLNRHVKKHKHAPV